jgi:general secretion pathway protein M
VRWHRSHLRQAAAALKTATDRLGAAGRLSLQGDRASLTLTNVASDDLYDWLTEVRSAARSRPIEPACRAPAKATAARSS